MNRAQHRENIPSQIKVEDDCKADQIPTLHAPSVLPLPAIRKREKAQQLVSNHRAPAIEVTLSDI
jgi:hypothetical protein